MYSDQPSTEFQSVQILSFYYVPPGFAQRHNLPSGSSIPHTAKINILTFARAIAKIAYAQTVAFLGLESIRPLCIPDLILGKYPCVPHFVGTNFDGTPTPPELPYRKHMIQHGVYEHGRLRLIYMTVRLFADSGTPQGAGFPIYEVLAGALKNEDAAKKLLSK